MLKQSIMVFKGRKDSPEAATDVLRKYSSHTNTIATRMKIPNA